MSFEINGKVLNGYRNTNNEKCVQIPWGVTKINDAAFYEEPTIEKVIIPETVTCISWYAFESCSSLKEIVIPKSVTQIFGRAFKNTPWFDENKDEFFIVGDGILIAYNGKEKDIVIPDSTKQIGVFVFSRMKNIESVVIPDTLKVIQENAFSGCVSLKRINIPNNIELIEWNAFSNCGCLEEITFPEKIGMINGEAFSGTQWLINQQKKEWVIVANEHVLRYNGSDSHVVIPQGIVNISGYAFERCTTIESITFPDTLKNIGGFAFSSCESLKEVTIPNSVTTLELGVFENCPSLKSITFSDNIINIPIWTCRLCISLTEVNLPPKLISIEPDAFIKCTQLSSIVIPDSVHSFGSRIFAECPSLKRITVLGMTLDCSHWDMNECNFHKLKFMIEKQDYEINIPKDIIISCAVESFIKKHDRNSERYIRSNATEAIKQFIYSNNYEYVKYLFDYGGFVSKDNVDCLLNFAIDNTQNGGDVAIQTFIMAYRADNFPSTYNFDFLSL